MSTLTDWKSISVSLRLNGAAFIDGRRVAAVAGEKFDCISPLDGRKIAEVARGQLADIDLAVAAARRAFADGRWSGKSPRERKSIMVRFAELMLANADELAVTETLDMGKPVKYSRNVDVNSAAHCIRWFGEAIDKLYDEIAPTPANALALVQREPVGVVGAIVPWNYPMLMACWKIAPALAAGNSMVLKPSEKSPLTALRLAELALEAGIPEGVFNVVPGFGHEAGAALALHDDVDCIAFTGSTRVGKQIVQYSGQSNLKRAWTELGGKSPFIVFADADLDAAVDACIGSIFFNQGESCNAPSRLLVDKSIADAFLERAVALAPRYLPGDPLAQQTVMGALVDRTQLNTVLGYIEAGKAEGAKLLTGGEQMRTETGGYFVAPTIFAGVTNTMKIAREEIFGPVLSVLTFTDAADAIRQANDTPYGLAASVWSRDINRVLGTARALRAGTVHVNCYDEDDITVPFGGYKQSGNGRDKSLHAFDKYTELKTTWIKLG
jgi:gamma-glutamyl-gamma-aminobutyraldehyde dehydrogenase/4-guanidinobutyraldehyde dehydrogenase/NAD-dependent aldehyde dehydrogenase